MCDVGCLVKGNVLDFLLAGRCKTTIKSSKTGQKFTYQINVRKEDKDKKIGDTIYFIQLAYGYMKFQYAGLMKINRETGEVSYCQGKKGKCSYDSPSIKGLTWLIKRELTGRDTDGLMVYHLGYCAKCGRELTDPVSIEYGLGPTCRKNVVSKENAY